MSQIKYFSGTGKKKHNDNECDRCGLKTDKGNLFKCNFLYMNKSDKNHPDMSPIMQMITGKYYEPGYRQYYLCKDCSEKEKTFK